MIEVIKLKTVYGENIVFENLNFTINNGEIVLIKGVNGRGKSTLCYALAGIIPRNIDADIYGKIVIDGVNINDISNADLIKKVSIVFQNPDSMLFSPTIEDELAFAPENLCLVRSEIRKRVNDAIELTGISNLTDSSPSKLSGGQKKMVAIASILTKNSDILIFDEVFNCLDNNSTDKIIEIIKSLNNEGKTIIMVEHSNKLDKLETKIIDLG